MTVVAGMRTGNVWCADIAEPVMLLILMYMRKRHLQAQIGCRVRAHNRSQQRFSLERVHGGKCEKQKRGFVCKLMVGS